MAPERLLGGSWAALLALEARQKVGLSGGLFMVQVGS